MNIRLKSDRELTEKLREALHDNGAGGLNSYEWHMGEVLYHGNPISYDNMTDWERKAAYAVQLWATTEGN